MTNVLLNWLGWNSKLRLAIQFTAFYVPGYCAAIMPQPTQQQCLSRDSSGYGISRRPTSDAFVDLNCAELCMYPLNLRLFDVLEQLVDSTSLEFGAILKKIVGLSTAYHMQRQLRRIPIKLSLIIKSQTRQRREKIGDALRQTFNQGVVTHIADIVNGQRFPRSSVKQLIVIHAFWITVLDSKMFRTFDAAERGID
ncbi:MAG TPA: hypothetical protein VIF60_18030 [Burkholderiaceae bacterium]